MLTIKGHYFAKNCIANIKYSFNQNKDPFALILKNQFFDLNAFRPDIRDNKDFLDKLENGIEVTVLYEKIKYTNKSTKIPRYVIYKDYYFVNVR